MSTEIAAAAERWVHHFRWGVTGDGRGVGREGGRRLGTAGEFEGYRAFQPGDELRLLDGRVYARTRQRVVRVLREDSVLPVTILIDVSASMEPRASTVAGLLHFFLGLARRGGDPVRVFRCRDTTAERVDLALLRGDSVAQAITSIDASPLQFEPCFQTVPPHPAGRGVVIVLSDAFGIHEPENDVAPLCRWGVPFWIAPLTRDEWEPRIGGRVRLSSCEREPAWNGVIDDEMRTLYRQQLRRFHRALTRRLKSWGGDFVPLHEDQSIAEQLRQLASRRRLIR